MSRRLDRAPFRYSAQWQAQGLCHRNAVAGGEIAIRVNGLQTDMRGASREMRPPAALDRVGVAPQDHRIDEPIATVERPARRTCVLEQGSGGAI